MKGRNTAGDPRVSLSMVDFDDPYTELQIRGRVVARRAAPKLEYFDSMSQKYVRKPWPYRDEKSPVALVMEVSKALFAKQPFEHQRPS